MEFIRGCSLEEYKKYYKTLKYLHKFYRALGINDAKFGDLGATEEYWIKDDPSHLLIWKENNEIVGHTIWHETSSDEHKKGDPRDKEDKEILRTLLDGKKDNIVELHEVWLRKEYRGEGYGRRFFEFFERFIQEKGFDAIIYYTNNPAAINLCRKRGYKEDFLTNEGWYVFCYRIQTLDKNSD